MEPAHRITLRLEPGALLLDDRHAHQDVELSGPEAELLARAAQQSFADLEDGLSLLRRIAREEGRDRADLPQGRLERVWLERAGAQDPEPRLRPTPRRPA